MAQFDVYKNLNSKTQTDIPYLLDIQADLFDTLNTRVVVPLYLANKFGKPITKLHPKIEINKKALIISTAELAAVPKKILGKQITSLRPHHHACIDALDFLFTGI